ncbi:F1F0-ATPase complex, subunit H [Spathaspora passalidarum NRRL Y-27907]|uniref:F1F0-ATPase complex, subunit H n=1 Tax=Spathaspora passalidarum (strain NRRL Y-27907 / 11-Y1) TaxID=619300 RepID=G3AL48_SPAPN|nr:F1F0-ATPase complex, subunit H [Spathaspora passalidarum NRRL Y-27907]EGW33091.1 F1F0-ATPase complex, subunit H [Spathaspora passalidarum NRRL Y-27907]
MFRPVARLSSRRLFSITPRKCNAISDLYIAEIKQFKPKVLTQAEIASAVQAFQLPAKPVVPQQEVSAEAVKQYETSDVELAHAVATEGGEPVAEDWFVFEEEPEEHH